METADGDGPVTTVSGPPGEERGGVVNDPVEHIQFR
jgi:hypothetical protein